MRRKKAGGLKWDADAEEDSAPVAVVMPIAVMPVTKIVMSIHAIMITTMMVDILVVITTVVVAVAPVISAV